MVKVVRLYPDMTFDEKTRKTEQNKILVTKDYTPDFKAGVSVFKERPKPLIYKILFFWKRTRYITILLDGCPTALSLEPPKDESKELKPALDFNFGTMKDTIAFLKKVTYKSIADRKPISNNQFLVLALLLGVVVMMQFMVMKGVTF